MNMSFHSTSFKEDDTIVMEYEQYSPKISSRRSGLKKVLVVDDNPFNLMAATNVLKSA